MREINARDFPNFKSLHSGALSELSQLWPSNGLYFPRARSLFLLGRKCPTESDCPGQLALALQSMACSQQYYFFLWELPLPQMPALFWWEFIKDKSIWFHTSRTRKNNTKHVTGTWADAPATQQYRWRLWFYQGGSQDPENWHPILFTVIPMGLPRHLGQKDEEVTLIMRIWAKSLCGLLPNQSWHSLLKTLKWLLIALRMKSKVLNTSPAEQASLPLRLAL